MEEEIIDPVKKQEEALVKQIEEASKSSGANINRETSRGGLER